MALDKYKRAVDLLEHEDTLEGEKKARRDAVMLANYLNVSLCHLRLKDTMEVIKACNKALELDPRSEKALFRRGQVRKRQFGPGEDPAVVLGKLEMLWARFI